MNIETFTSAMSNAGMVVGQGITSVVNMIASNVYLSVGFGIGLLGLGIAFVRKIRRL